MEKYDALKLENQLCFPLYACAREIVKAYKPYLDKIDLTYTQYITMMVLWENPRINVKDLGNKLYLDSGTLTPLLKKLEQKGFLNRNRSKIDERVLVIEITDKGLALRDEALGIPKHLGACVSISKEEFDVLYKLLYKVIKNIEK